VTAQGGIRACKQVLGKKIGKSVLKKQDKVVVLDIRDSPWCDGPGRTIIEVGCGLKKQGIDIKIASFISKGKNDSDYLNKARESGLDCLEIEESRTLDFSIIGQILEFNRQIPIDLIHSHDLRSNIYGLIAAKKLKLPIVTTAHGWVANTLKRKIEIFVDKLLLSYLFDVVITVSDQTQKKLRKFHPRSKRMVTVHNTLDTKRYQVENTGRIRDSFKVSKETPLIAKIGRLSPEKRQVLLISAVKQLVDEGYDFKLLLIGIGPDEARLRQLTDKLGLKDVIKFAGFIQKMQPVYSELDLVVQTSSTEGMPNVVLESMLMRVPVIATDVGGTAEIIDSPDVGTLIEPDNQQQLVDELRSFLDDPQTYRNKVDKAEQRIRAEFDSTRRLEKMASIYHRVNPNISPGR
jgi:glycosyltransferase involved in cell wall biosynthesis